MTRGASVSGTRGHRNQKRGSNLSPGMRLLDMVDDDVPPPVVPSLIPNEPSPHTANVPAAQTHVPPSASELDDDEGVADVIWDRVTDRVELNVLRKHLTGELMFDGTEPTRSFRPIFRLDIVEGAVNWSTVPADKKEFYFQEFRKKFKWRKGQGSIVRSTWEEVANIRYKDFIHECKKAWEKNKAIDMPRGFSADVWKDFTEYWSDPEVCRISEQHATNRRCGGDIAPASHTGGSMRHFMYVRKRTLENNGKMPTLLEVFEDMHTLKDGTTHCNSKSANIIAECKRRKEEMKDDAVTQQIDDSSNGTDKEAADISVNKMFFTVLKNVDGGYKNGKWYGAEGGTSANPFAGVEKTIPTSFDSDSHSVNDEMKQWITQMLDAKLAERDARLLEQVAELIRGAGPTTGIDTSEGHNNEHNIVDSDDEVRGVNN